MNFSRVTSWAQVSDDGKYTVCCIRKVDGYRFEAWLRGSPDRYIGASPDAEEARQLCRDHKAQIQEVA